MNDNYIIALMVLIQKSRIAAGRSELPDALLREAAGVWFDAIGSKIPFDRLDDAERKANSLKADTFPLHFTELAYAWTLIDKDEAKDRPKSDRCLMTRWHLEGYDKPHIYTSDRNDKSVIVPCPLCRDENEGSPDEGIELVFEALEKAKNSPMFAGHWAWKDKFKEWCKADDSSKPAIYEQLKELRKKELDERV